MHIHQDDFVNFFKITFKRKFLAGLFITIPGVITAFVIVGLFKFVDGILGPFLDSIIGRHIAGLGFIAAVICIFLIGIISTNVFGKKMLNIVEHAFQRIPVFKSLYNAVKQLIDAFSPDNKTSFKQFVIVEYPRKGAYAFGFLTKECQVIKSSSSECLKTVYIPTNNLYLGEIILLPEESITYTDINIEDGIKIILSGGITTPGQIKGSTTISE
ncbi:MAG: DUF502 domain-containing protein [Nitrospiraceae bacterium]|nr:DUF502 domain-containing protein [Nitrospiraceae bacterium]